MKKILAPLLAFLLFGLVAYDSASANEGRESLLKAKELCAERLKSGSNYEKVLAEDDTLIVCAKGEKAAYDESGVSQNELLPSIPQRQACGIQNIASTLKSSGLSKGYVSRTLIQTLYLMFVIPIFQKEEMTAYDYAAADSLFSQIEDALAALDWEKEGGWYIVGEGETSFDHLRSMGEYHWQRYGKEIIALFGRLAADEKLDQFGRNQILVARRRLIEDMLFSAESLQIAENQRPDDADKRILAYLLLEFARSHPDQINWWLIEDRHRAVLADIAPEVLAELEEIIWGIKEKSGYSRN